MALVLRSSARIFGRLRAGDVKASEPGACDRYYAYYYGSPLGVCRVRRRQPASPPGSERPMDRARTAAGA